MRGRPGSAVSARLRLGALLAPALVVLAATLGVGLVGAVAQSLGHQPYLPASLSGSGRHLGLGAYRAIWSDPAVRASYAVTARVAGLATLIAMVLGVAVALLLRSAARGRSALTGLLTSAVAVPHVVGAAAIGLLLSETGLVARLGHGVGLVGSPAAFPSPVADRFGWGILAEYAWKETAFVALVTLAALGRGVAELEEAARTLGAGPVRRLLRVTLPVVAPSVLGAGALVLAFAVGSYEVPYLLGRPYPATLSVVAYQDFTATDLTVRPQAMALAVVITLLTGVVGAAVAALASLLSRRGGHR